MINRLYSKEQLVEALRKAKLPCSRPTFKKYEEKGIILRPANALVINTDEWRIYTLAEIKENVQRVSDYTHGKLEGFDKK